MAIAVIFNLDIHQMDVITDFLNEDFIEIIYMDQPEGYDVKSNEYFMCLLAKGLYGLRRYQQHFIKKINSSPTQGQK